jgi:hypothetical protein
VSGDRYATANVDEIQIDRKPVEGVELRSVCRARALVCAKPIVVPPFAAGVGVRLLTRGSAFKRCEYASSNPE